jgi:heat shock protein HslJ
LSEQTTATCSLIVGPFKGLILAANGKNAVMKRALLLSALCFTLLSCTTNKASMNTSAEELQGRWELTLFAPGGKEFAELFGQRRPELEFNTTEKKVFGTTGCNQLSGNYTVSGSSFQFGTNMALTKMACPTYDETAFLNAMSSVNRFLIRNDQLQLLQDSTLVMAFTKKQGTGS